MKISAPLLKSAIDFVMVGVNEECNHSQFVQIKCNNKGLVQVKLASNLLVALSARYVDEALRTSFVNDVGESEISFVVDCKRLGTYLQHNSGELKITSTLKSVTFKGNGQLTLSFIQPQEYLQANYDSELFTSPADKPMLLTCSSGEEIARTLHSVKFMVDWADRTSPQPLFKNINLINDPEGVSVRNFKNNIIVFANKAMTSIDGKEALYCDGLIDPISVQPLLRLTELSTLSFFIHDDSNGDFSLAKMLGFVATNQVNGIQYWAYSRIMGGSHQVQETIYFVNEVLEQEKYVDLIKEDIVSLIGQSEGYLGGEKQGIRVEIEGESMKFLVDTGKDIYENSIVIGNPNNLSYSFSINLFALKKITSSLVVSNIRLRLYYDEIRQMITRLVIIDKGTTIDDGVLFLFTTIGLDS